MLICMLGLAAWLMSVAASAAPLPSPTGTYLVGSRTVEFRDPAREEVWTEAQDDRRLQVRLWYPASSRSSRPVPYVPELKRLLPSLNKYWGDSAVRDLSFTVPGASLDAPIARGRFPLVILSHGMNAGAFNMSWLAADLASRGYVVAAVDHTYWGPGVAFADGSVVGFEDGIGARNTLTPESLDRYLAEGIRVFSADQSFVARKLLALSETRGGFLYERLDESKVGIVGHSMGGKAADLSCLHDRLFKACVSLDGSLGVAVQVGLEPECSPKPFLLIVSDQFKSSVAAGSPVATRLASVWCAPTVELLAGSRHSSFTDLPLLGGVAPASIDSNRALAVTRQAVRTFFNSAFGLRNGDAAPLPELHRVSLAN